jgi:hypothetical protein
MKLFRYSCVGLAIVLGFITIVASNVENISVSTTRFLDRDGDGYGDPGEWCTSIEERTCVVNKTDCDDSDDTIHPNAAEICNDTIDQDCNGSDLSCSTWYRDFDTDGYGDPNVTTEAANQPAGYTENQEDCNDSDASIHPGAEEICDDGIDQNCDKVDEDCENPYGIVVVVSQIVSATTTEIQTVEVSDTTSSIKGVTIEVPPNALSEDTTITIGEVTNSPELPDDIVGIGTSVEFGPSGITFDEPVTIKIPYSQEDLDNLGIIDPNVIKVFTFNTATSSWEEVLVDSVNIDNKLVICKVDHFSIFTAGILCESLDSDDDGTSDCNDNCPDDPDKTDPGDCGCGTPEGTCEGELQGDDGGGSSGGSCFINTLFEK